MLMGMSDSQFDSYKTEFLCSLRTIKEQVDSSGKSTVLEDMIQDFERQLQRQLQRP